jgi:hypothetical protein
MHISERMGIIINNQWKVHVAYLEVS